MALESGPRLPLLLRAMVAFLALPGMLSGLVPWLIVRTESVRGSGWIAGVPVLVIGLGLLLACVRDFHKRGRGTLAPWDAPKCLVVIGLYRYCRNPMYIGVLLIVAGWAVAAGSARLCEYLVVLGVGFHLRVLLYEEPTLERLFGEEWRAYAASVPRWVPRPPRAVTKLG